MLKKTVLFFTVFALSVYCRSSSRINIEEREKDIDLISELIKLREGPCSPNPCKNGGECEEDGESFICTCKSHFTGDTCEQSPCAPNPCQNDGKCSITNKDDATCLCKEPFSGEKCEKGPCTPNPCKNGGKCMTFENDTSCLCPSAYFGEYCEKGNTNEPDILMSTSSDSMITSSITNENFTDIIDSYNWTSSESSIVTIDEETTSTDSNSTNDTILTTLEEDNHNAFPKENCETDSDCLNGGTCRKKGGKNSCVCAPNFGGFRCEVNLPCVSLEQSCRIINAVCILVDNHAICECPNGTLYHRKSGLCEDICDPRKCSHGKWEIIGRTYKCNCDQGYTGNHCDEKEKGYHENFVPWFSVIASIGLFICILLIAMFCVICQIKTKILENAGNLI